MCIVIQPVSLFHEVGAERIGVVRENSAGAAHMHRVHGAVYACNEEMRHTTSRYPDIKCSGNIEPA